MNPYAYIAGISLAACLACQRPAPVVTTETHVIDSLYRIDIPSILTPGYDMHDYASLQYYNTQMNYYVLGIEDAKENLGEIKRMRLQLDGYYTFVENTVFEKVDSLAVVAQSTFADSIQRAQVGDYYTTSEAWGDVPLFYRIAIFENSNYFFQLVVWMPYDRHCEWHHWTDTITNSFHFLRP